VARVCELGLLNSRGRQRPASPHGLAAVRLRQRGERGGDTRRALVPVLAVVAPAWGRRVAEPPWFARDGRRVETDAWPTTAAARKALAHRLGVDGHRLLPALAAATDHEWRRHVPAVVTRRRLWGAPSIEAGATWRWRAVKERPAAAAPLTSPDAPDARDRTTRAIAGRGDQVPRPAPGDADTPPLMVQGETTPATTPDDQRAAVGPQS
jgi:hypothetical protein